MEYRSGEMDLLFIRSGSLVFSTHVAVKMKTTYPTTRQTEREVSQNIILTSLNIVNTNSQSCVSFMRKLLHLLSEPRIQPLRWRRTFLPKLLMFVPSPLSLFSCSISTLMSISGLWFWFKLNFVNSYRLHKIL